MQAFLKRAANSRPLVLALLGGLLFIALRNLVITINIPAVHDAIIMHFFGYRLLEGDVPYRDIFDINFPGAHLLHAFIISIFGTDDIGIKIFDTFFILLAALSSMLLIGRKHLVEGLFCAAVIIIAHSLMPAKIILQRDLVAFAITLAASFFAYRYLASGRFNALFVASVLCAAASTIKPTMGLFIAAFFLCLPFTMNMKVKQLLKAAFVICGGVLAVWLPVICWLEYIGGLGDFIKTLTGFSQIYSWLYSNSHESWKAALIYAASCAFLIALVKTLKQDDIADNIHDDIKRITVLNVLLLSCLLNIAIQDKGFLYHKYPFYIALKVFIIMAASIMFHNSVELGKHRHIIYIIVMIAALVFYSSRPKSNYDDVATYRQELKDDIEGAYKLSATATGKDAPETMQFFDVVGADLFYMGYVTGLAPATKQVTPFCIYSRAFTQKHMHELCANFRDELERSATPVIAISKSMDFSRLSKAKPDKEFTDLLERYYTLYADKGRYKIYARIR